MKKKLCSIFLMICILITVAPQMAWASYQGSAIRVRKVSVDEEQGEVDVKFGTPVMWSYHARLVSIKDNKGKSYKGYLTDMDDDDCEVYIRGMKAGKTYKIKISGVKAYGASKYKTITVTAKVPAKAKGISVKKTEYEEDYDDGRMEYTVSFDFNKRVHPKHGSYVLITDSHGKAYSTKHSYVDWDGDDCEVHLTHKLTIGKTYSYEIGPVKAVGKGSYMVLKGNFVARHHH